MAVLVLAVLWMALVSLTTLIWYTLCFVRSALHPSVLPTLHATARFFLSFFLFFLCTVVQVRRMWDFNSCVSDVIFARFLLRRWQRRQHSRQSGRKFRHANGGVPGDVHGG